MKRIVCGLVAFACLLALPVVAGWSFKQTKEIDFVSVGAHTNLGIAAVSIGGIECYWNAASTGTVKVERVRTFTPSTHGTAFTITNLIKSSAVSAATNLFLGSDIFESIHFIQNDIIQIEDNTGTASTNYTILTLIEERQ